MEATLDIEEDVLRTAELIAAKDGVTPGKVLSDLARRALANDARATANGSAAVAPTKPVRPPRVLFPPRGEHITSEHVKRLREQE